MNNSPENSHPPDRLAFVFEHPVLKYFAIPFILVIGAWMAARGKDGRPHLTK